MSLPGSAVKTAKKNARKKWAFFLFILINIL